MNADIKPGDLVVCVDVSPNSIGFPGDLRKGAVYRVDRLGIIENCISPECNGQPSLWLAGVPATDCGNGRLARRFRKLNDEPDNTEIVERIKQCKPSRIGVSA